MKTKEQKRDWQIANRARMKVAGLKYDRHWTPERREAHNARARQYYADNKARIKIRQKYQDIHRKYGLTSEQYDNLYKKQNGLCALLCGRPIECVDHCHVTKTVRELLCHRCNAAIGMLDENIELMQRAIAYIVKWRKQ